MTLLTLDFSNQVIGEQFFVVAVICGRKPNLICHHVEGKAERFVVFCDLISSFHFHYHKVRGYVEVKLLIPVKDKLSIYTL